MKEYDVGIIGGGPAGLGAAVYAGRAQLKTVFFDKFGTGGQMNTYDRIANYPGFFNGISTSELGDAFLKHAQKFGAQLIYDEITKVENDGVYRLLKGMSDTYKVKAAIIATGVRYKTLGVPGEDRLRGRGVSYCATCDGPFFQGKEIAVIGGGDSALQEAVHLTQFGSKVTIIHRRDQFRAYPDIQEKIRQNPKIATFMSTVVESIEGKDTVDKIALKNTITGQTSEMPISAVFIFVGLTPNTEFLEGYMKLEDYGYIKTDDCMYTDIPGFFAAGDVRAKDCRQVITAVSDGVMAAQNAWKYISNLR